jgi:DNA-binding CsgD family transcriptional regulator
MKHEIFNQEFNKQLKWLSNESTPKLLNVELDIYKKLWNSFVIGDGYFFVLNHNTTTCDLISKDFESILGYTASEFSIDFMNEKIHPEDKPWYLSFGHKIIDFFSQLPADKLMKYKLRYDLRYRKKSGNYARMMYQGIIIEHDQDGRPLRSLGTHSDVSHLKMDGKPSLSFIGLDGEPSVINVGCKNIFNDIKNDLTLREKQILKLLMEGRLSKEIGNILHISKQTVDTHRKNMLRKNRATNTNELIGKAIRNGWI